MSASRLAVVSLALVSAAAAQQGDEQLRAEVDSMFDACKADTPGAVVLVARGQRVVLQKAYGLADLERRVPLTVDSIFDIGSTSKQFTAACVLLLEQDGKLTLGDLAKQHVPELPACCEAVTVRHLVLHTSGIPDYVGLLAGAGSHLEDRTTAGDALAALRQVAKLDFAPGTKWAYSNSNYFLLSQVVERAAGTSLTAFAQRRLFTPLGMTHTHIHDDCTLLVPDRALSYSRRRGGAWRWEFSNWEQTGDGAVLTTVGDLLLWARNFDAGKVGGDKLLAAMAAPGTFDDGKPIDYGMGLMFAEIDGKRAIRHGGAWAAYRAELVRVPEVALVVMCLCNRPDLEPSRLCSRIVGMALRE